MSARAWPLVLLLALGACATAEGEDTYEPEVRGPHGIEGYRSYHALFYVVPVAGGVVLVDTGYDDDAEHVTRALKGRRPFAVFLTHGHVDHWAGAWALGDIPTYVGRGDIPRIRGEEPSQGLIPGLADRFLPTLRPPKNMVAIDDGQTVEAQDTGAPGAWSMRAIHLPGHTAGSTAWLYGDVLFGGDAAMGGDELGGSPPGFDDDTEEATRSLRRLKDVPFRTLLDGHTGRTDDGETLVRRFLQEHSIEPLP